MLKRAVQSFCAQTYQNKRMLLFDTGAEGPNTELYGEEVWGLWSPSAGRWIGELRNDAIDTTSADIICHFDSDDWSNPRRIEEQVALLESSGAEAVGYNEVIFWDETMETCMRNAREQMQGFPSCGDAPDFGPRELGEAYVYSNPRPNYAIGASLAYWRSTWQRRPFPHMPIPGNRQSAGEDAEWLNGVKCVSISGVTECALSLDGVSAAGVYHQGDVWATPVVPRLICSVHGSNSQMYELSLGSPQFKRAAQGDEYCRAQMRLEGK